MSEIKKLKRSQNKIIAGVCAGIGEYFEIDTNLVRILWVIFSVFGGAGLVAYVVCILMMPNE